MNHCRRMIKRVDDRVTCFRGDLTVLHHAGGMGIMFPTKWCRHPLSTADSSGSLVVLVSVFSECPGRILQCFPADFLFSNPVQASGHMNDAGGQQDDHSCGRPSRVILGKHRLGCPVRCPRASSLQARLLAGAFQRPSVGHFSVSTTDNWLSVCFCLPRCFPFFIHTFGSN